jgi:redox-sensing transcriptional repressor
MMFEQRKKSRRRTKSVSERGVVSVAVIRRLPRYHRFLGDLLRKGELRISSARLSSMMGVTASQIRQDLNCFGGFGQQGYGYNVRYLYEQIGELLGVTEGYRAVIVGAGNLGRALVSSHMFERRGVVRTAMFDTDENVIGRTFGGVPVYSVAGLEEYVRAARIDIGVLTTPKDAAEGEARRLAAAGVKGIWNFSNQELTLPDYPDVIIENMHMGDSLMMLCYAMKEKEDGR